MKLACQVLGNNPARAKDYSYCHAIFTLTKDVLFFYYNAPTKFSFVSIDLIDCCFISQSLLSPKSQHSTSSSVSFVLGKALLNDIIAPFDSCCFLGKNKVDNHPLVPSNDCFIFPSFNLDFFG